MLLKGDTSLFFLLTTLNLILYICSGLLFFSENRDSWQLTLAIVCLVLAIMLSLFIGIYYYKRIERNCTNCTPDCVSLDFVDCDSDGLECCGVDCN